MPSTLIRTMVQGGANLIERSRQIAEELGAPAPDKVKAALMALFCRVV